ncbi:MAG: hypothetical protein LBV41_11660 [Cytophagaceae bacterium]|nr:hypothetical protein [Cytophagaceae bacterium]
MEEDKVGILESIKANRQRMRTAWAAPSGKCLSDSTFNVFFKFDGRYKCIRKRPKGKPLAEHYKLQTEKLAEFDEMSQKG